MREYNHLKIEKKWQKIWERKKLFRADDKSKKKKFYGLIEFPYPSGDGLHVGHIRSNTAMDVIARKRRAEGYNVLYPIGWDAFGLPTENYAVKTGIQPKVVTKKNTGIFRRQLKALGFSFDWSREINTTDPAYYKWTQWIFLQFLKRGLAYKKKMAVNWCPNDKIVLANEEAVDGKCERCGTPTERREKEQWMLAITKYADRLDKDLDTVDFLERIKIQQKNWIGRSEGVNFKCKIKDLGVEVRMYNSVPQTYRAETFTVIAPEHPLVERLIAGTKYEKPVTDFLATLGKKRALKQFDDDKEMEGIFTGRYIENYAGTGRDLPIWVASYVVADYGSGIVNASAHDERDFRFAKKYGIPLHEVVEPLYTQTTDPGKVVPGLPFEDRNSIIALVKHWRDDKYIALKWKEVAWRTLITGGIESNQTAEEAARAEIREETGYLHPKLVKDFGLIHATFYHVPQKVNRFAHSHMLYFQLADGVQEPVAAEERQKHDVLWLSADELAKTLTPDSHRHMLRLLGGTREAYVHAGILKEPEEFRGREWHEVRSDIIDFLVKKGYAERAVEYKLRDWIFSRQRYWGEPIPVIHCEKCGYVPVPEQDLPIKLPPVKNYRPTDTGESPLAAISKWVNVKCPKCRGKAKRETDTMPNWAGSSWYYLRYADPKNKKELASQKNLAYWTPVDWYNGGMEHTTLHLLYSRFWHKFLYDLKLVLTNEPYARRTSHGLILAEGGVKMSKSKGNVVNPDNLVKTVGADSLRVYEMFMGPFDQSIVWDTASIAGSRRFLERVWKLRSKVELTKIGKEADTAPTPAAGSLSLAIVLNQTIKKVGEDIEAMKFNTAVSQLMILVNAMEKEPTVARSDFAVLLKLLAPFAPHIAEELWQSLGGKKSIGLEGWPAYDPLKIKLAEVTIVVQLNGKVRADFIAPADISEEEAKRSALVLPKIAELLAAKTIKKTVYVKGKLLNIVV